MSVCVCVCGRRELCLSFSMGMLVYEREGGREGYERGEIREAKQPLV